MNQPQQLNWVLFDEDSPVLGGYYVVLIDTGEPSLKPLVAWWQPKSKKFDCPDVRNIVAWAAVRWPDETVFKR